MKRSTKAWLITAACLVVSGALIGGGVLAAHGWDFTALDTVDFETKTVEITEPFRNISVYVNTADVVLALSTDGTCKAVFYEPTGVTYSAAVQGGTLLVEATDKREWADRLTLFSFRSPTITLYVPADRYDCLIVKNNTGSIRVEHLSAAVADLTVSTGTVEVSSVTCETNMSVKVGTGQATLTEVSCENLTSHGSTGGITLNRVIAADMITVERSTGDIRLTRCDAERLALRTSTGSISGSLLSEKSFHATSGTGRVSIPDSVYTGGVCTATTRTGDISLVIA